MTIKRLTGIYLFEVINSNPNGDPDSANSPRINPNNGKGVVSHSCINRKIRDYAEREYNSIIAIRKDGNFKEFASKIESLDDFNKEYFDVRMFGNVFCKGIGKESLKDDSNKDDTNKDDKKTKKNKKTKASPKSICGAVQVSHAFSVDPISTYRFTNTRMMAADQNQSMGNGEIVDYGLYKSTFYVDPKMAKKQNVSEKDIDIFIEALMKMWEGSRSACRTDIHPRALVVFEHENDLDILSHKLINCVKIVKNIDGIPTKPEDYSISIDEANVPSGIKIFKSFID